VLIGPVSDVAAEAKRVGGRELRRRVTTAERIARRDPDGLVPSAWGFWSARRYISLYRPGEVEDVFPYYRGNARWTTFRAVRLPVAAILGSRDEFLDRPAPRGHPGVSPKRGARPILHRHRRRAGPSWFSGTRGELADLLVRWVGAPGQDVTDYPVTLPDRVDLRRCASAIGSALLRAPERTKSQRNAR
jgi:hypothetical protein